MIRKKVGVIGAGTMGELFVRATPDGLAKIEKTIQAGMAKRTIKEISTIATIEAVVPDRRRLGISGTPGAATRVRSATG